MRLQVVWIEAKESIDRRTSGSGSVEISRNPSVMIVLIGQKAKATTPARASKTRIPSHEAIAGRSGANDDHRHTYVKLDVFLKQRWK
ncbi:hypothetical protein KCV03_g11, partial [Aureobasidium melanogenum]